MAQQFVRADEEIQRTGIPPEIPDNLILPERIFSILSVIYSISNEGCSTRSGERPTRTDLPDETRVTGLMALGLLRDLGQFARISKDGIALLFK